VPISDKLRISDSEIDCGMRCLASLGSQRQISARNQIKARRPINLAVWHMPRIAETADPARSRLGTPKRFARIITFIRALPEEE
jgi:hypothetical protein